MKKIFILGMCILLFLMIFISSVNAFAPFRTAGNDVKGRADDLGLGAGWTYFVTDNPINSTEKITNLSIFINDGTGPSDSRVCCHTEGPANTFTLRACAEENFTITNVGGNYSYPMNLSGCQIGDIISVYEITGRADPEADMAGGDTGYRNDPCNPSCAAATESAKLLSVAFWVQDYAISPPLAAPEVSLTNPPDNDHVNINNISFNFNVSWGVGYLTNFSLWINSTGTWKLNQSNTTAAVNMSIMELNLTLDDGEYIWNVEACDNNSNCSFATGNDTIIIDTLRPSIDPDKRISSNKSYFHEHLIGQINASDPHLFQITALLDNNFTIYNKTNIASPTYQFNLSLNISNITSDVHKLTFKVWDGHTNTELKEMLDPTVSFGDLKFNNEKDDWFKINPRDYDMFNNLEYERKENKYSFSYEKSLLGGLLTKDSEITIDIESNNRIYIPKNKDPQYKGWVVMPDIGTNGRWVDLNIKDVPEAKYEMEQISNNLVRVKISNIPNDLKVIEFDSAGELNLYEVNYTFYRFNYSISYDPNVVGTVPRTYTLNITRNQSYMDSATANFDFNGTIYTTNSTTTNDSFIITKRLTDIYTEVVTNMTFNFTYDIVGLYNNTNTTATLNQSIWGASVGLCNASFPYVLLNITYEDELSGINVNATNEYDLIIYDGYAYYNQTGTFTEFGNHALCTSLPFTLVNYSWTIWNNMQLNSSGYAPRFIHIDPLTPYEVNNTGTLNLTFLMIPLANSTTMVYNWFNTQFQTIDGTMNIYKCNPDGTRTLTESIVIVSGRAVSNIELFFTQYAYSVVTGGVLYRESSYFTCHIETSSPSTYYIDQTETDILPIIGLYLTSCSLKKAGNNTANLTWGSNYESAEPIEGCIIGYRGTVAGRTKIYENCSVTSPIVRTILDDANPYYVIGEIRQGIHKVQCGEELDFFTDTDPSRIFGAIGIFAVIILISSLSLLWLGSGNQSIFGAALGLLVVWGLGIVAWGWTTTGAMIAFLLIVALTGRYNRKQ